MSGAMIALIVIVVLMVLGGGSCAACMCIGARSAAKSIEKTKPTPAPAPAKPSKPANDNWITAERPFVKFLAPPGWNTEITPDKEWGIFKSPAKDAVFAFTTFHNPGESTIKLAKADRALGVSDINWGAKRFGNVGKDKFSAAVGDGSCNFRGPGGYIWYATVDSGTSDQMLLIFTVAPGAPAARRQEAQAAVDSLQRR